MKSSLAIVLLLASVLIAGCGGKGRENPGGGAKPVILVTGATGSQGGAVARELLKRGYKVRGLTRNPDSERADAMSRLGAVMVKGNFDDPASLAAAMDGAYGVFAVTDYWEHGYDGEVAHGRQLIDAAKAAGIGHFVFTSVESADIYTGVAHFESKGEIEAYLRESGINYSVVRPVEFMDNVQYMRADILSGVYFDPREPGKSHQWIAVSDIGFFVGEAFDNPEQWYGRELDIAGDQLTIAEFVDDLSRAAGLDVHHQQITWSAYEEQAGEDLTRMVRWFDEKGYGADVEALRQEYPNLLTYREYLQALDWD